MKKQHNKTTVDSAKLSYLLAMAVSANLFELIIPRIPVLPWLKIGLANIFSIAVIVLYSPSEALRFIILRTFISGFLSGSPATSFMFSGAGGLLAVLTMGIAWKTFGRRGWLGLTGIGISGAAAHNTTQLVIAYLLFVKNAGFLWQIPFMLLFSIISGTIVGILAKPVIKAFRQTTVKPVIPQKATGPFLLKEKIGFPIFLYFVIGIFIIQKPEYFVVFYTLLIITAIYTKTGLLRILKVSLRFWGLFAWNIIINMFFTPGHFIVWTVSYEGLERAGILSLRLFFCIGASVVFIKNSKLDFPLYLFSKIWGGERMITVFSGAMAVLPKLVATGKNMKWKTISDFKTFINRTFDDKKLHD